jgi:membrane associated rhomboid family serine protease
MLYLWVFGNNIEDRLGHLRFTYFYLFCGALTGLFYSAIVPNSVIPLIGASGAISAVLGAYFLLYPTNKVIVLIPFFIFWKIVRLPAFWFLLIYILLQFFYGGVLSSAAEFAEEGGIAWFAHILGFVFGAVLLGIFLKKKE